MGAARRPAVVIVNYNAGDHLAACVRSLRAEGVEHVVVVDNGSSDGSTAALLREDPAVRVVEPGSNTGYGQGVNAGVAATDAEAILVTNPDVVVAPGAVEAMTAALEQPRVGLVGPTILDVDGILYPSARTFPSIVESIGHGFLGLVNPRNRFTRSYRMLDVAPERRTADWVSGACFLVRREAFDQVGGFDPAFFMFSEDVDLCWRIGRAGWTIVYEPAATITHVQGVSRRHHPYRMVVAHHRSLLQFAARTTEGRARALLPVVAVGLVVRTLAVMARTALGRPPI